jgi:uncharacterized protein (DUF362 family)
MNKSTVSIVKVKNNQIGAAVNKALELSKCMKKIKKESTVVLKPNLITDNPDYISRGANTSSDVIISILKILQEKEATVYIGESEVGTHVQGRRLEKTWKYMNLYEIADKYNATLLNFTRDEKITVDVNGLFFKQLEISKIAHDCDLIINLPKIKTHKYAKLTCAMKNMFGAIPEPRRVIYHKKLDAAIADINKVFNDKIINVVDGIIGMEGDGPLYGSPVKLNLVLASDDQISLDTVVCKIIGQDHNEIDYIINGSHLKLGNIEEIMIVGEDLNSVKREFKKVSKNAYRVFEDILMKSPLVHIIITPGFQKHISKYLRPITKRLRGGSFTWYLDEGSNNHD